MRTIVSPFVDSLRPAAIGRRYLAIRVVLCQTTQTAAHRYRILRNTYGVCHVSHEFATIIGRGGKYGTSKPCQIVTPGPADLLKGVLGFICVII